MASAREHALQMVAQLRVLDPSFSGEVGTPERKLLDTVAQKIHDNEIDLDALSAGLDLDSKYGAQLDRFLHLFGQKRREGTFATGFVTFSRSTEAIQDTRIPAGTMVRAHDTESEVHVLDAIFVTTYDVTIQAGETSVIAPVRATTIGDRNNVSAGQVTQIVTGAPGVTDVTNEAAIKGGRIPETDEEFKVRFKNTIFRNLAGTQDQYMALAIATSYSSKANVIGPQSHYREYIQVPPVDDASSLAGTLIWKAAAESSVEGEWASVNSPNHSSSTFSRATDHGNFVWPEPDPWRLRRSVDGGPDGRGAWEARVLTGDYADNNPSSTAQRSEYGQGNPVRVGCDMNDRLHHSGEERYFSFAIRLPSDYPITSDWHSWFQIKQMGSFGSPVIALESTSSGGGTWRINTTNEDPDNQVFTSYTLGPLVKGTWVYFTIRVVFSADPTQGRLQIWGDLADGQGLRQLLGDTVRPTMKVANAPYSHCGTTWNIGDTLPSHVRMGIYRSKNYDGLTGADGIVRYAGLSVATSREVSESSAFSGTTNLGGGAIGEYTTALSTLPYAKHVYSEEHPVFVSNGQIGVGSFFYRHGVDFRLNTTPDARNRGDARRFWNTGLDDKLDIDPASDTIRPNVTFTNVYTGEDADIQAIRPRNVVLLEYSYMSGASRNDLNHNITNAVDVFVDGGNDTLATNVVTRPSALSLFVDDPTSPYHYENYRRAGEPARRPVIGNVLLPLLWQPVLDLPDEIAVGDDTFFKGTHYWAVEETSSYEGTIRARNGIEWATQIPGETGGEGEGKLILDSAEDPVGGESITIEDYSYDRNILELQAALDGSKQVTTDVLAHRAKKRYFKLDVTIMYDEGASILDTNAMIRESVDVYLRTQYFGSAIQLSDLLQAIHNTPGVDNVRWSADAPGATSGTPRVIETNRRGDPLLGITVDRIRPGNATQAEIQRIYLSGRPTSGNFRLRRGSDLSGNLPYNTTAAQIQAAIIGGADWTVVEDSRTDFDVQHPIRSFTVTYNNNGARGLLTGALPSAGTPLRGGDYLIGADFFLLDNELARLPEGVTEVEAELPDTVPGLILRPRAQNTWSRWQ